MSQQSAQRAPEAAADRAPSAEQRALPESGAADAAPDQHAGMRTRMQQVLAAADDIERLGAQLCEVLCSWPGVLHAALFRQVQGDLRLAAQHGGNGLDLASVLQGGEQLQQSPLRTAFPGLRAAVGGEVALLDLTGKAGDAKFARALRGYGAEMAAGLPVRSPRQGQQGGSLSLLFARNCKLTPAQLGALDELAQLAGIGLRMAELGRETESLRERLSLAATVDALTGVYNRRHGEELLEQEVRRARRYGMPLTLIACDIDRFTEVNDHYGHPVGDMALRAVAATAQELLRSSDALVRSGGGEFQVIVPHTSEIDALKLAEKLRVAIEQTAIPGCDFVTVSFGVAQLEGQESGGSLAVRASGALARAKRAGRNRVEMAQH